MVEIVKANLSYISEIYEIEQSLFSSDAYSFNSLKDELENENRLYFLAIKTTGSVVGYLGINILSQNECEVMKVAVKKEFQKMGIAKKLFNKVFSELKTKNFTTVNLEVEKSNNPAISLYEKLGFELKHVRKNYYSNGQDALIYIKNLNN